jgi:hypothetical protein
MNKHKGVLTIMIGLVLLLAPLSMAQSGPTPQADIDELKKTAPRVYIDCDACDIAFIKTEITFVNYVRDRKEAQVHVLITTDRTASRGWEYTLTFIGQIECAGQDDVLKYYTGKTDTEDEIRQGLVQTLKVGLMRYVAKAPISRRIAISLMDPVKPTAVVDKWRSWVFSLSGTGAFSGERSYLYSSVLGTLSADRTTPALKIRMNALANHTFNRFRLDSGDLESTLNSLSFSGLVVKSLNEHWSVGAYLSLRHSSYGNIEFAIEPAPAVEFDLFPYSQSTRRQLRFLYKLGYSMVRYMEETVFDKMKENRLKESISATLELKEKWGTISASLQGSHYFSDLSKYRLALDAEATLRLYKGLSFEIFGSASRIHDQLSLSKQGASIEDILLMRKQLATSYQYWFSVGLSYTFGSIYSNVVNPRFGTGSIVIYE